MKRIACIFAALLLFCLAACQKEAPATPTDDNPLACGDTFATLDEALLGGTYDPDGADIVIATVGELLKDGAFSDVRALEIQQTVHGDLERAALLQMKDGPRLSAGKTYLLLLLERPAENEYEIAGYGNQCAFWIESGKVQCTDADFALQLREESISTLDGLADYFTARLAALETTE